MNRNETFSALDTHTICMDMVRSSIDVQSSASNDIQVLISGDDDSVSLLSMEWKDGTLMLSMPMRDRMPNLMSPAWMQILLRLPVSWKGGMELKSQSGNISVNDFTGTDLLIHTVSGHIRVDSSLLIAAELHSTSGILLLQKANVEQIKMSTVSGDMLVKEISCSQLSFNTVSGSCEIHLATPFEKMTGSNVSGDTHVSAPLSEINASLATVTGRILTRNISIQETGPLFRMKSVTGQLEVVGDIPYSANQEDE